MARARILKPGFFTNEVLAELPFEGRLLFQGLWVIADREGRLEDRPRRIKAAVFPWDEVDVQSLLIALETKGFIERYTVNAMPLIQIAKFHDHQKPHHREPASILPGPEDGSSPGQARPRRTVSGNQLPVTSNRNTVDSSEARTPTEPPFLVFPVVGIGAKNWELLEAQISEWAMAFPMLDIRAEARKALAWVDANPGRRKTDKGMKAFLVAWLNRATNRGGGTTTPAAKPESEETRAYREWREKGCQHTPTCPHFAACRVVSARKQAS